MNERTHAFRRRGHAILMAALFFLVSGALLLWAWNTIAIELLQAPAIRFKHVLALQAAVTALAALPVLVARYLLRADAGRTE